MNSSLVLLTAESLGQIAGALRSGRLTPPFTPLLIRRYVPVGLASGVAADLQRWVDDGILARHMANSLELLCHDRRQRPAAEDVIDLVWTGPEAPGIVNRDTRVVVREMFRTAKHSVLVAGYAVYQGHVVFKELADRMEERPGLEVQMFLDVQRPQYDPSSQSELVRVFAERFIKTEWPGRRLPRLYYDPRSLEADHVKRASLHAKCVVVDWELAFVSSANFTRAAQTKNVEVGVLLRSPTFSRRLSEHFESLAALHVFQPIPTGGTCLKHHK